MNQITTKVDSDDKRMKINKFKLKKIVFGTVRGDQFIYIYIYIYISSLIIDTILNCYSVFLLISWSLSLIASFSFYTLFSFHLYFPRADQIVGVDTCPISIFLKSLCSSCKAENHCSGITSTLMRSED